MLLWSGLGDLYGADLQTSTNMADFKVVKGATSCDTAVGVPECVHTELRFDTNKWFFHFQNSIKLILLYMGLRFVREATNNFILSLCYTLNINSLFLSCHLHIESLFPLPTSSNAQAGAKLSSCCRFTEPFQK